MSIITTIHAGLRGVAVVGLVAGFSLPVAAGEIYSWRTEDGGYAFTDDAKAVPARYRGQVKSQKTARLADYARLTTPSVGASEAYSRRLAERLEHLRGLNRDLDDAHARRGPVQTAETLSVESGGFNIGLPLAESADGPLVIEKIRFRHEGEMATRHNLVVRQGSRQVAIIRGNRLLGPINQAPDIETMVAD